MMTSRPALRSPRAMMLGLAALVTLPFAACKDRAFNAGNSGKVRTAGEMTESDWGMREYAVACHDALGPLPETINCSEATEVPMTLQGAPHVDALVAAGEGKGGEARCDDPIMSVRDPALGGCIPGTRVRRISTETTDFVFICRRRNTFLYDKQASQGGAPTKLYDTVAFIGHNRVTNKACFIERTNAVEVPRKEGGAPYLAAAGDMHADYVTPLVPAGDGRLAAIAKQWEPMSIDCTTCHSSRPFVASPAVSRLKQSGEGGRNEGILPRLAKATGTGEGGSTPAPYTLVEEENLRRYIPTKGYITEPHRSYGVKVVPEKLKVLGKPRTLVSEEAVACAKCHDIGGRDYLRVLVPQISGVFPEALAGNADSWASFVQYAGKRADAKEAAGAADLAGAPRAIALPGHHDEAIWRAVFKANPERNTPAGRKALLEGLVACGLDPHASGCKWVPTDAVEAR